MRYQVVIYWSDEHQAFIAETPDLPECRANGDTSQEALDNLKVVINQWLEAEKGLGHPILDPEDGPKLA